METPIEESFPSSRYILKLVLRLVGDFHNHKTICRYVKVSRSTVLSHHVWLHSPTLAELVKDVACFAFCVDLNNGIVILDDE